MEREERDSKQGNKAIDTGALVGSEDPPPLDGAIGEDHRHVERDHRRHHMVEVGTGDHRYVSVASGRE